MREARHRHDRAMAAAGRGLAAFRLQLLVGCQRVETLRLAANASGMSVRQIPMSLSNRSSKASSSRSARRLRRQCLNLKRMPRSTSFATALRSGRDWFIALEVPTLHSISYSKSSQRPRWRREASLLCSAASAHRPHSLFSLSALRYFQRYSCVLFRKGEKNASRTGDKV